MNVSVPPEDPLAAPGLIAASMSISRTGRPEKVPFPFDGLAGGFVGRDTTRCQ
jgi:hypothetical protein